MFVTLYLLRKLKFLFPSPLLELINRCFLDVVVLKYQHSVYLVFVFIQPSTHKHTHTHTHTHTQFYLEYYTYYKLVMLCIMKYMFSTVFKVTIGILSLEWLFQQKIYIMGLQRHTLHIFIIIILFHLFIIIC